MVRVRTHGCMYTLSAGGGNMLTRFVCRPSQASQEELRQADSTLTDLQQVSNSHANFLVSLLISRGCHIWAACRSWLLRHTTCRLLTTSKPMLP